MLSKGRRKINIIIVLVLIGNYLLSQESGNFLLVSIVTEKSNRVHKVSEDYWLVSFDNDYIKKIVPLYVFGFSNQDILECKKDSLVFYNLKPSDSFSSSPISETDLKNAASSKWRYSRTINRKKSSTLRRKVYLTEIEGTFIFCRFSGISLSELGYQGDEIAMPMEFRISKKLKNLYKLVDRHDFFELPHIGLHEVQ